MFTGIIEEVGKVTRLIPGSKPSGGVRIVVQAKQALAGKGKLREGESISVNGVCLTARDVRSRTFAADLSPETLERSSLGSLKPESRVNLERAMTPSTRFGGHIVQGHVDGVGRLVALDPLPDGNYWLSVDILTDISHYVVYKGSIALNGISLTVAKIDGNRAGIAVIPFTYEQTNLSDFKPGDPINIECDILAKYAEKMLMQFRSTVPLKRESEKRSSIQLERMIEEGF